MTTNLDYIIIFTTAPTPEDGERIARTVVEERLAACASIIPHTKSVYWWEGKMETATEQLVIIKTRRALFAAVRDRILQLHPYKVPEILAVPVEAGSEEYLRWLKESTSPPRD